MPARVVTPIAWFEVTIGMTFEAKVAALSLAACLALLPGKSMLLLLLSGTPWAFLGVGHDSKSRPALAHSRDPVLCN